MSKFTTIYHEERRALGLNIEEYCVADLIFILSSNPSNNVGGWCYMSKENIGEQFGLSVRTVFSILSKLALAGLIERHESQLGYIRTTAKWYDSAYRANFAGGVQELQVDRAKSAGEYPAKIAHNSNTTDSNNDINKYTSEDKRLVDIFFGLMKQYNPIEKRLPTARDYELMRLMRERDKYPPELIEAIIHWCWQGWWEGKIISIKKLREKFTQLAGAAKADMQKKQNRTVRV